MTDRDEMVEAIRRVIEGVCSDGNADSRRVASDVLDVLLSEPVFGKMAERAYGKLPLCDPDISEREVARMLLVALCAPEGLP